MLAMVHVWKSHEHPSPSCDHISISPEHLVSRFFGGVFPASIYITHLALLLLCALGDKRVASLVLSLPQIISPPVVLLSNASNLSPSMLSSFPQSSSALTSISYKWDKESFGQRFFDSCMDAYPQLPAGSHARSYGDHATQQNHEFPLPLRYAAQAEEVLGDGT